MTCCANITGYHEIQDERITAPVFSNANPLLLLLPLHKKQEDLTNKSILFDLLRKGVCLSAQKSQHCSSHGKKNHQAHLFSFSFLWSRGVQKEDFCSQVQHTNLACIEIQSVLVSFNTKYSVTSSHMAFARWNCCCWLYTLVFHSLCHFGCCKISSRLHVCSDKEIDRNLIAWKLSNCWANDATTHNMAQTPFFNACNYLSAPEQPNYLLIQNLEGDYERSSLAGQASWTLNTDEWRPQLVVVRAIKGIRHRIIWMEKITSFELPEKNVICKVIYVVSALFYVLPCCSYSGKKGLW